ncbi:hypothetical protein BC832DRAFT_529204 [Gaertneriomyces semiglobifer]|nr:hypothetical protein BC832DRAFT_529204 [Gaertneriomyces semiglobifer]
MWFLLAFLKLPWRLIGFFSRTVTATITFNYWTLFVVLVALTIACYVLLRYRFLTKYPRLSVRKRVGVPFDLHPDTAFDDKQDYPASYPDELMGAFLSSIKIFGYLDRAVFHELARHLRTRKLKAGEVLFHAEDDVRDFYVVVDGAMQVFVKGPDEDDDELSQHLFDGDDGPDVAPRWPGHHLLNVVRSGGTVCSLFNVLAIFSEKMGVPTPLSATKDAPPDTESPDLLTASQAVFPGLRNKPSTIGAKTKGTVGSEAEPSALDQNTSSSGATVTSNEDLQTETNQIPTRPQIKTSFSTYSLSSLDRPFRQKIAARAATDTTLAVIPAEAFQKLTEKFPKAAAHMIQVILTRLQRVTFMSLYRYLGLSKELLKIEHRVNEVYGSGLPEDLLSLKDFQKLRDRANILRGDQALSDIEGNATSRSPRSGRKTQRGLAEHRARRSGRFKEITVDESYEGDIDDSERGGRHTLSPRITVESPSPSTPFGVGGPRHVLDDRDDSELRESVFSCMAGIIGMVPHTSPVGSTGSISSPMPATRPSPSFHIGLHTRPSPLDDFDDAASTSSRASIASSLPPESGGHDINILFCEQGSILIEEGQRTTGLYFVIDGVLEASVGKGPLTIGGKKDPAKRRNVDGSSAEDSHTGRKNLFLIRPGGIAGYLAAVTGYISFVTIKAKTDVYLGFLPKPVLDRYIERHTSILLALSSRLLTQLSPLVLHIDAALGWDQINGGQVLCREGEPSNAIYMVLNGRLRAIKGETGDESFEILNEYGQGESVGELEVLTDAPREATIHAIRDTEIAVLPKTLFNALALRHPEITIAISRIIAERSKSAFRNVGPTPNFISSTTLKPSPNLNLRTVCLLPVNAMVPVMAFADQLVDAMRLIGADVRLLNTNSVMSVLGKHAFSRIGRLKLNTWLSEMEEAGMCVFVADGKVGSPWTARCVRQADCILLVGLAEDDPNIGEFERLLVSMKSTARKELVLLHSTRSCRTGSTAAWLKNRLWIHAHHHIQMNLSAPRMFGEANRKGTLENLRDHFQSFTTNSLGAGLQHHFPARSNLHGGIRSDFARLARRLLSKSVGLVLGGGGARGISHIGVIHALEEAGIPIDMVGGTSIGSFVGGLYARENDMVSVYGRAKMFSGRMMSKWRQLLDLTWPVVGLFQGHGFNRGIWKCFGDSHIEDCWLPYFAVTTNITWSRMEVHQSGYMWRYIRASMSLAGYFPPLCDDGNMLLDGGYLNNLPADIMKSLGAKTIIAVDVGSVDDTSPVTYGDSLSGWWVLMTKFPIISSWALKRYGKIPGLADIQARLAYVSSVKQLEEAKNLPGCHYWNPPVQMYGTLEFDKFLEIYKVGLRYGREAVRKWEQEGLLETEFGVRPEGEKKGRRGLERRASI